MSIEEVKKLEKALTDNGYRKYTSCLSSSETFGYFKSFAITLDEDGDRHVGYQIEFRFWDWGKYGQSGDEAFGVDITMITSGTNSRTDLVISTDDFDIEHMEKIGEDFYEFLKIHERS